MATKIFDLRMHQWSTVTDHGNFHGSVGEFVPGQEDWTQYAEWLGHFLTANGIDRDERKKAVLLTTIGAKAYQLLRNLVSQANPGD